MAAKRVESLRAPCLDAGSTPASSTGRGSPTSLRFTIPPLTEWLRRGRFPIFGICRTAFLSAPVAPALQPKEGFPRVGEALAARSLFHCEFRQAAAAAAAPSCRLPRIRRTSEFPPVPAGRFRLRVRCGRTPSRNPLSPFLRCRDACRPPDLRHLPDVMGGASGIPRSPFPRRETRGCCCARRPVRLPVPRSFAGLTSPSVRTASRPSAASCRFGPLPSGCLFHGLSQLLLLRRCTPRPVRLRRRAVSVRSRPDACSTVFCRSYFSVGAHGIPSVCGVVPFRSAPVRMSVPRSFAALTSPPVHSASRPSACSAVFHRSHFSVGAHGIPSVCGAVPSWPARRISRSDWS